MRLMYIGVFGLLGVFARYFAGVLFGRYFPAPFPNGTFCINFLGSFLIGIVYVLGTERAIVSADLQSGLMIGLIGGFTTFSAYTLELSQLIEESKYWIAAAYFGLSPLVGLLSAFAGIFIARFLVRGVA